MSTLNPYTLDPLIVRKEPIQAGYKIIFKIWEPGRHWCCYMGLVDWPDERVVNSGDEVSYEVAEALFPGVAAAMHGNRFYYN